MRRGGWLGGGGCEGGGGGGGGAVNGILQQCSHWALRKSLVCLHFQLHSPAEEPSGSHVINCVTVTSKGGADTRNPGPPAHLSTERTCIPVTDAKARKAY